MPPDEFLVPMVLASDMVVRDGELIGDPTEGALVALAAKGASTRSPPGSGTRGSPSFRSTRPAS